MNATKRLLAGMMTVVMLCCVLPVTACAEEMLTGITTTQSGNSSYFTHRMNGTGKYFFANVKNGGKCVGKVTLSVLSSCTVYQGKQPLTGTLSSDKSMVTHTFSTPGSYSVKIVTPASAGDSSYASFAFTVLAAPEQQDAPPRLMGSSGAGTQALVTVKADAPARRVVYHASGASYITTVTENARLTQPAKFMLTAGMTATYSKDAGQPKVYVSGTELCDPGNYTITFKSTGVGGKEETTQLSFVIDRLVSEPDIDYSSGSLLPKNAVSPGRANFGEPAIGGVVSTNTSYSKAPIISFGGPYSGGYYASDDGLTPIRETYHADFETYEQEFTGVYFYTNVSNGSITAHSVTLDIPAGVVVTMAKDGLSTPFTNKLPITKLGSYVLTLQRSLPDGTTATGLFRFRIQRLPTGVSPTQPQEEGTVIVPPLPPSGELPSVPEEGLSETPTEEDLSNMVEELTKPEQTHNMAGTAAYTGLAQTYDSKKQSYLQQMGSGTKFYTSIPNGAVVNGPVYFSFASPLDIELLHNGQPVDYLAGAPIEEHGVYRMTLKESSVSYLTNTTAIPAFSFRILAKPVRDTRFYYPPEGFTIDKVTLDGADFPSKATPLRLTTDGSYEISMTSVSGDAPAITVKLVRDTVAPVFTLVGVENGRSTGTAVTVEYSSDDLERVELLDGGKTIEGFAGYTITDPGDYTLKVLDKAGNVSSAKFVLTYRLNVSAILAVLLVVLLAAAGVVFFLHTKKDILVR
ncbi:MAG: hypothetical protein RR022_05420 [Angelakisella sp.]